MAKDSKSSPSSHQPGRTGGFFERMLNMLAGKRSKKTTPSVPGKPEKSVPTTSTTPHNIPTAASVKRSETLKSVPHTTTPNIPTTTLDDKSGNPENPETSRTVPPEIPPPAYTAHGSLNMNTNTSGISGNNNINTSSTTSGSNGGTPPINVRNSFPFGPNYYPGYYGSRVQVGGNATVNYVDNSRNTVISGDNQYVSLRSY